MPTVDLTADSFEQTIAENEIVLVDFWAAWCGPCRQFAPIFEAASEQHPEIVFAKIDTEAEQQLAAMAQISSIPTLMAFRDQVLVFAQPGALPAPALQQVIEGVRSLDMDDVRRQVAEQQAAEGTAPSEIDVEELAAEHAGGAVVLDVREQHEWDSGHLDGALHVPMDQVPGRLAELPADRPVYVLCHVGGRSAAITEFLRGQGLQAVNVRGGIEAWQQRGYAVVG